MIIHFQIGGYKLQINLIVFYQGGTSLRYAGHWRMEIAGLKALRAAPSDTDHREPGDAKVQTPSVLLNGRSQATDTCRAEVPCCHDATKHTAGAPVIPVTPVTPLGKPLRSVATVPQSPAPLPNRAPGQSPQSPKSCFSGDWCSPVAQSPEPRFRPGDCR